MLSLRELLIGEPLRLRYLRRFSTCRVLHDETVAEHCFYTALYTLFISDWVQAKGHEIDVGLALSKALVHDMEEARTGDLPRFFKHANKALHDEVEKQGALESDYIFSKILGYTAGLSRMKFHKLWRDAKDDTLEGRIVSFADFLSCVSYISEELRSSNATMKEHLVSFAKYMDTYKDPRYEFLRPLIEEAFELCEEIILCQL